MSFPQMLSSPGGSAPVDFVDGDLAALALHMQRCARSRGALSGLRGALRKTRIAVLGHLVTVAFVAASAAATVLVIARG